MRLKIIAGNLVAILVVGVVSYFFLHSQIEQALNAQVDGRVRSDVTLFDRSFRLSALEFVQQVEGRAATQPLRGALGALDQDSKRQRAFNAVEGIAQWFRDPSRRGELPAFVALTDETGRVLARNQDINRMFGAQLAREIPALRAVLDDGEPRHDGWITTDDNKLMQVAVAPVRNESGGVIGALVVGYELSNGLAAHESSVLGCDVAFVVEGRVNSSSLEGPAAAGISSALISGESSAATTAALGGTQSNLLDADLGGHEYAMVLAPLPLTPSVAIAYATLIDRSASSELANSTYAILLLMLLGAIGVIVYGFIIGGSFLRPLEEIEEAVLAVINGRTDLRIDVESAEFGGLAYRINQLINVFTGVSETDEEGHVAASQAPVAGGWSGGDDAPAPAPSAGGGGGGGSGNGPIDDPAIAGPLAAESEADYGARIYQEYVAAKQAAGEDVSGIPQERFLKRLTANGDALAKKHGVSAVRFQVEARGAQVVLRPVLLR